MEFILQSIFNGLVQGSFFSLWAVGLVLIFGVMGVVNFAHGELVMIGAYTVWLLYTQIGVPFFLAIGCAIFLVAMIGAGMEFFLFRPTRNNLLGGLICSIGVLFTLQVIAHWVGGTGPSKQIAPIFQGTSTFFSDSFRISNQKIFSLAIIIPTLLLLWFFLSKTRLGWALKAVALDREAAALQGININRIAMLAIIIGAALAGLAGALISPLVNINPYMGHSVIITSFIVTIVGGVGSLLGAVIASFLYAILHTFITFYIGDTVATICGLLIMLLILIIKPTGIMGKKQTE